MKKVLIPVAIIVVIIVIVVVALFYTTRPAPQDWGDSSDSSQSIAVDSSGLTAVAVNTTNSTVKPKTTTNSPTTSTQYYFGGMYGTGGGTKGASNAANYTNPLAGDKKACPTGYKSYSILGTLYIDYGLYLCLGPVGSVQPVAQFGGMYGTPKATYANPLAKNTRGCPTGYQAKVVYGSAGNNGKSLNIPALPSLPTPGSAPSFPSAPSLPSLPSFPTSLSSIPSPVDFVQSIFGGGDNTPKFPGDYFLGFCYAPVSTAPVVSSFGGAWSEMHKNPVTNAKSCPSGSTSKIVLGTVLVDYPLTFCYVPVAATSTSATASTTRSTASTTP